MTRRPGAARPAYDITRTRELSGFTSTGAWITVTFLPNQRARALDAVVGAGLFDVAFGLALRIRGRCRETI